MNIITYNELGNIEQMQSVSNWTRNYYYNTGVNTLKGHTSGVTEYTYDAHGNTISMPHLSSMNCDHKDELKDVDLGGGGTAYYTYDASGERTRKVIVKAGGIVEQRIYLGGYEIYRKHISGNLDFERETLRISDDRKAIVDLETKTVENGSTIATPTSNLRYQYDNHLGSACLELDSSAAIISYEEYHPFGTTSYRSGRTETEVSLKRYKYVGKERDEETGLYYYGARYYAGWIARWINTDPAGFVDGLNLYAYVKNNPLKYSDSTGLQTENDVDQTHPKVPEEIQKIKLPEFQVPEPAVADNTNLVNHTAYVQEQLSSQKQEQKQLPPEIIKLQEQISDALKNFNLGYDVLEVTSKQLDKRFIMSSQGMLFKKQGDPRLKVSGNKILSPDDAPKLKSTGRHIGMSDDLTSLKRGVKLGGLAIDIGILSADLYEISVSENKSNAWQNFGKDALGIGISLLSPEIGLIYGFGESITESKDFQIQMMNHYKDQMDKYKNSNGKKYNEASRLYNKYWQKLNGNQEYKPPENQLYFKAGD